MTKCEQKKKRREKMSGVRTVLCSITALVFSIRTIHPALPELTMPKLRLTNVVDSMTFYIVNKMTESVLDKYI